MYWQGRDAIKWVERVKIEANPGRIVEQVGGKGVLQPVNQRDLDPPLVPIILPAVKAIARNRRGQLGCQRPGHHHGKQQVSDENCHVNDRWPRPVSTRDGGALTGGRLLCGVRQDV